MSKKHFEDCVDVFDDNDNLEYAFDNTEEPCDGTRKEIVEDIDTGTNMPTAAESYIREINKRCPQRTSPEESIRLGRIMKTGSEKEALAARNALIEGHLVFALKYVLKYRADHAAPLEDLIQSANIGLMKAAANYDYTHGVSFTTYARPYLTKEITFCLANTHRNMPLSEYYKRKLTKLSDYLSSHPENAQNPAAIAAALNISVETAESWLALHESQKVIQLDRTYGLDYGKFVLKENSKSVDLSDTWIMASPDPTPDEAYVQQEQSTMLREQMESILNKLELKVVLLRTGMEPGWDGVMLPVKKDGVPTFEDIGQLLGCGKTRAWQAFNSGINKLKKHLNPEDFTSR